MDNKNTITFYFKWHSTTPDPRQFNQQRQVMYPFTGEDKDYLESTVVAVKIPLKGEFVFNADKVITAQLSSDKDVPEPMLTPAGMFLAIQLLEEPFLKKESKDALEEVFEDDEEEVGTAEEEFEDDEPTVDEDTTTPDPDESFPDEKDGFEDDEDVDFAEEFEDE